MELLVGQAYAMRKDGCAINSGTAHVDPGEMDDYFAVRVIGSRHEGWVDVKNLNVAKQRSKAPRPPADRPKVHWWFYGDFSLAEEVMEVPEHAIVCIWEDLPRVFQEAHARRSEYLKGVRRATPPSGSRWRKMRKHKTLSHEGARPWESATKENRREANRRARREAKARLHKGLARLDPRG